MNLLNTTFKYLILIAIIINGSNHINAQTTIQDCTTENDATLGDDRNDWTTDDVQSQGYMTDFTIPDPGLSPSGCEPIWTSVQVCIDLNNVTENPGGSTCNLQGVYGNIWLNPPAMMDGCMCGRDWEIIGGAGWNAPQQYCIDLVASGADINATTTIGVDVVPAVDPNTDPLCPTTEAIDGGFISDVQFDVCIDYTYIFPATPDAGPDLTAGCNASVTIGADPIYDESTDATYAWSSGDSGTLNTGGNPSDDDNGQITVSPTTTTTYTVTITESDGCTGTDEVTVTVSAAVTADAGNDQTICAGQSATIGGSPVGSTGNTYSWSSGANGTLGGGNNGQTSVSPATTTTYTVTVTDSGGCSSTDEVTITVSSGPSADAGNNQTICSGQSVTIGGSPVSSSGNDYSWSTGANGTINGGNNGQITVSPTTTTTYTVVVTDGNSCTQSSTVVVTVGPSPTANAVSNSPICEGNTLTLNENGGNAISWSWTGPNGFTSNSQNPSISNVTTAADGIYTVVISISGGCTNSATVDVTIDAAPTVSATSNSPVCGSSFGPVIIDLNETGGDAISWSWEGPNGFTSNIQNPSINVTPDASLVAGNYTVTITGSNNCTSTDIVSVTVLSPDVDTGLDQTICSGESVTIGANPVSTNGMQFLWSTGFAGTIGGGTTGQLTVSPTSNEIYSVTITDPNNGCNNSDIVTVFVNDAPTTSASNNGPLCVGNTLTLNETGGDAISWSWEGPNGFTSTLQSPSISNATTAATGTYTVTTTGGNSCTSTATTMVTINPSPNINLTSNSPICAGNTLTLNETGGGATSWSWQGPNGFTSSMQNPSISNVTTAASGVYTVTITDGNTCTNTTTINVTVNAVPTATATSNSPVCQGETLSLNENGGDATAWSWEGPNGFTSASQSPSITNVTAAAAGTYTVTITDSNTCTRTAITVVSINTLPTANATSNSPVCVGSTLTFSETGGDATAWSWEGPNSFTSSMQNPSISNVTLSANGTYTVTITDGNSCTNTATVTVSINDAPTATATSNSPICQGNSLNLGETGGDAVSWSWEGPSGFTSSLQNPSIATAFVSSSGIYTVTVTDGNSCTSSATVNVVVNGLPTATATSNSPQCEGSTLTLNETGGVATIWSWEGPNGFVSAAQNPSLSNVMTSAGGTYTVTVTDGNSCTNTATTNVVINTNPIVDIAVPNIINCANPVESLDASGSSSGVNINYNWSGPSIISGGTTTSPSVVEGGTYTITVTNTSTTCSTTGTINVVEEVTPINFIKQ